MNEYQISPKVDQAQEFIEIANDFANPLDLVREAISNAFDARASKIEMVFETEKQAGETVFVIKLSDNGSGMAPEQLQSFFDLGNSTRRNDSKTIGEKGHGTKVYFHSKRLVVDTCCNGLRLTATLDSPITRLHNREIPTVNVVSQDCDEGQSGTQITIFGYNNNRREKFTHDRLRDHIYWFTKFGSIENRFGIDQLSDVELVLKGLDRQESEVLEFGHPFPAQSGDINALFEQHTIHAPKHFCKQIVKSGSLPNHPEIKYQVIFSIEGNRVKYEYNPMLTRPGYSAPEGAYKVQDRYGVWLCKDFIPIQRKNEWITSKGSEFTKFHAFFNCQDFKLTANRGSIENTPAEILQDVELIVKKVYDEIVESEEWLQLTYLEDEAQGYNTVAKERKNFQIRVDKVNKANIAAFKGAILIEPSRESGVHSLVVQLMTLDSTIFPFTIVDYDTLEGIDVIVKSTDKNPTSASRLFYVEFKYVLSGAFNHSFENLHSIICWDTDLKHNDVVKDINSEERKLSIHQAAFEGDYIRYYLDSPRKAHKIEVFVLKDFLQQKLGISFRPRTEKDTV